RPAFVDCHDRVGSGFEQAAKLVFCLLEVRILFLECLFEAPALGYIPDGRSDEESILTPQWTETDFDRKLGAVLAQTVERDAGAHRSETRFREESRAMTWMIAAETRRHEHFDRLADDLVAVVSEELFRL